MGDPSVVVGYWIPDRQGYVDEDGKTLDIPANDNPANDGVRTVTVIPDGHDPLAVLIHDAAVGQDPELIAAVSTAARMAMTNARLRAGIRERAVQIAESRRRIVEEADRQRQHLESRLALGPLGLLVEVSLALEAVRADGIQDVRAELDSARHELLDYAHGVRPADLSRGGLAAALPILALRSPVPVDLSVGVARMPAAIEAC